MKSEHSPEGWTAVAGVDLPVEDLIDLAFDYRGDVTVVRDDGQELTGYVFNRAREGAEPFLRLVEPGGAEHTLRYAEIHAIKFTGRDPAAGKSYEAWLRRHPESPRPSTSPA